MKAFEGPRVRRARLSLLAALLPLPSLPGCSITGSGDGPTLLVTNGTCDPGPCVPLTVYAFPADQPRTPGGIWSIDLGMATQAVTCFALPPSRHFDVTNAGAGKTTTYTWTPGDAVAIGSGFAYASTFVNQPSTDAFVPAEADGWGVTLPEGGKVLEDHGCDPHGS